MGSISNPDYLYRAPHLCQTLALPVFLVKVPLRLVERGEALFQAKLSSFLVGSSEAHRKGIPTRASIGKFLHTLSQVILKHKGDAEEVAEPCEGRFLVPPLVAIVVHRARV